MDTPITECSVCSVKGVATGKHYGAVTCYSCRAFFRRVPERKRPPRCKFNSSCPVNDGVKKQCAGCRFMKCINEGMQLELVLNEDEKKERFKASLAKKQRAEDVPHIEATSQTRFEEESSRVSVEEPINPRLPQRSFELSMPNSLPRAVVPPFQSTVSSYNNRPTGTVAPMLNLSASSTWTSPSIFETNINTFPSRLEQNTTLSSIIERNTSLFSRFERNTNSLYSRLGQTPISLSSLFEHNTVSRPYLHSRPVYSPPEQERTPPTPACSPYQNMPPLQQVGTQENFSPLHQQSSTEHSNLYHGWESNLSRNCNSLNIKKDRDIPETDIKDETKSVIIPRPFMCHQQPGSRESVILMSNRKNQEEYIENSALVKKDDLGLENVKKEDEIVEDIKDDELTFISKEDDMDENDDDQLIFKYIHKKFGTKKREWAPILKKIDSIASEVDPLEGTSSGTELLTRKRKSVIVKHSSPKVPFNIEELEEEITEKKLKTEEEDKTEEIDRNLAAINPFEKVKLVIDIPAINAMCTKYLVQEEKTHLETIKITFSKAWDEISLGERIMIDYTKFCQTKEELTSEYFEAGNRQFRERYLNFICSLQLSEDISVQTAYHLFKENLRNAEMLTYVHVFNISNWALELDFVLGQKDKDQWRARDPSISGMSITKMMQFMPLLEETKMEMYTELMACTMPIFKDKTVLILMVLITVFDLESDESVKRIKNGFLTILRRYLQEHGLNDVDYDMQNIINCITALPRVYKLFKEMSREPEKNKSNQLVSIEGQLE